jgi:aspartate aminotransferase-like enzyme
MPRFYFDLAAHRDFAARGETPWTPAVSVIYQLDVALGLLEREGAEAIVRRHAACAAATRAGLTALGFALYGDPRFASPTVTAAWVPDGLDWQAFNAALLDKQLVLAGGQGKLAGKVFRVGHLGSVTLDEILAMFGIIEETLTEFGRPVELGAGVAAAQRAGMAVLQGREASTELAAV